MSIKSFISITVKSESKMIARRVRQSTNLHMIWDRQRAYNQDRTHKSNYRQSLSRFVHIRRYYPDIRWCRSSYSRLCSEWSPPYSCRSNCLVCWSKSADNMRHPLDIHSHLIKKYGEDIEREVPAHEGPDWILTWHPECWKVFHNALFFPGILSQWEHCNIITTEQFWECQYKSTLWEWCSILFYSNYECFIANLHWTTQQMSWIWKFITKRVL